MPYLKEENMNPLFLRPLESHPLASMASTEREEALETVRKDGLKLQYVKEEFKADLEIALAAIGENSEAFHFAGEDLKNNRDFALAAVRKNASCIQFVNVEFQRDLEILLAVFEQREDFK